MSIASYGQPYAFVFTQIDTAGTDQRIRQFGGFTAYFEHNQAVNYPNPAITTQHEYDYYFRITAHEIDGSWANFDAHMNRAIDRGAKIGFRVYCIDDTYGGNTVSGNIMAYPVSWHTSMQGEANPDFTVGGVWWPNYNSPTFLANIALMEKKIDDHLRSTFHTAFGTSWRYKECVNYRDIDFIGIYGEGHTYVGAAQDTWTFPTGTFWTLASLQNIINTEKTYVRNIPMIGNVNFFASNSRLPAGFGAWFAQESNGWGPYGLRLDNFGNKGIFDFEFTNNNTVESGINFKSVISNRWLTSPFLVEPIQFGFGDAGQVNYYDIKRETDLLHLTLCENADNIMNRQNPVQTDVQNLFRSVIKRMAYRLTFVSGQMSDSLRSSGNINIQLTALNMGIAPPYEDYEMIYLFKQGGVTRFQFTSTFHPKGFLPGTQSIIDNQIAPAGISGGYQMYLQIRQVLDSNNKRFRKPMQLQINTVNGVSSQQSDTSYFLRTINVASTGSTPPPPPPPPPNQPPVILIGGSQTDTLPKSVDTLYAQISDANNDNVSYTWTQSSGPNTATMGTASGTVVTSAGPASILNRISGLIEGSYSFRLTANDGKGGIATADMAVLVVDTASHVDPPPPPPPPPVYLPPTVIVYGGSGNGDTTIFATADSAYLRALVVDTSLTPIRDTSIQSIQWFRFSGNGGTIVSSTSLVTKVTGLLPFTSTPQVYQYYIVVTDKAGNIVSTISQPVKITVIPVNNMPPPRPIDPDKIKPVGIKAF